MQTIVYAQSLVQDLLHTLAQMAKPDAVVWLFDTNTYQLCAPLLQKFLQDDAKIIVRAGDVHKDLSALSEVWSGLQSAAATRHSLLVNVGGGMLTDLGGFAAATYKRGIRFVNVPTTLLAMVDAAVGGKTGVNFGGFKNEIGAFHEADVVFICTDLLRTLDMPNLVSGYAEMLKHSLLSNREMWARHLQFPLENPDFVVLQNMVRESISFKQSIVAQDPHEKGLRKSLNLGHTIGHALESVLLHKETPMLHGYAVAWGLLGELYLSVVQKGFPVEALRLTTQFVVEHYGRPNISCKDYEALLDRMRHDKKNVGKQVNFTLLSDIGQLCLDETASDELIKEALDFIREG